MRSFNLKCIHKTLSYVFAVSHQRCCGYALGNKETYGFDSAPLNHFCLIKLKSSLFLLYHSGMLESVHSIKINTQTWTTFSRSSRAREKTTNEEKIALSILFPASSKYLSKYWISALNTPVFFGDGVIVSTDTLEKWVELLLRSTSSFFANSHSESLTFDCLSSRYNSFFNSLANLLFTYKFLAFFRLSSSLFLFPSIYYSFYIAFNFACTLLSYSFLHSTILNHSTKLSFPLFSMKNTYDCPHSLRIFEKARIF